MTASWRHSRPHWVRDGHGRPGRLVLSRLRQTAKVSGPGSGFGRQSKYAPAHPFQQAVGRVASGQAYDQPSAVPHHPPGRLTTPNRTVLSRLFSHSPPIANRLTAEFRLSARVAMDHQAALASNSIEGNRPAARSLLRTPCTSSPLPQHSLYHLINSSPAMVRLVTTPYALYQPSACPCPALYSSAGCDTVGRQPLSAFTLFSPRRPAVTAGRNALPGSRLASSAASWNLSIYLNTADADGTLR